MPLVRLLSVLLVALTLAKADPHPRLLFPPSAEADVKQGRISISSPISRALIGKSKGETVEVAAPGGARSYEIIDVKYK